MIGTAQKQSASIKQSVNYTGSQPVKDAVTALDAAIVTLQTTVGVVDAAHQTLITAEPQRVQDAAALHRAHDGLVTAINNDAKGVRKSILAWNVAIATRDVSVAGTDPPVNVRGKSTPGTGSVTFQCTADRRAVVYWFGWGTDPSNPDAWTGSAIESGVKHVVTGLPVGTKVYFRMLVQRTRVGKGVWSDVVEVTVR